MWWMWYRLFVSVSIEDLALKNIFFYYFIYLSCHLCSMGQLQTVIFNYEFIWQLFSQWSRMKWQKIVKNASCKFPNAKVIYLNVLCCSTKSPNPKYIQYTSSAFEKLELLHKSGGKKCSNVLIVWKEWWQMTKKTASEILKKQLAIPRSSLITWRRSCALVTWWHLSMLRRNYVGYY